MALEQYFRNNLIEQKQFIRIGGWWNRKGGYEIDIVAENELSNTAVFYELKRKAQNNNMDTLKVKAAHFIKSTGKFQDYNISYHGLSMEDM